MEFLELSNLKLGEAGAMSPYFSGQKSQSVVGLLKHNFFCFK